jgi:PKD repeat protein
MKPFKLHRARRFKLTSLSLSIILVVALELGLPFILPASAQGATIAVDPVNNIADPTESFTVNVTIADVVDLYSYEVKLGFDEDVLEAIGIEEGPFIKDQTTAPQGTFFSTVFGDGYVYVACVTLGDYPGVSGGGTLLNVTFTVKNSGESTLHLYDTMLIDYEGGPTEIPHGTSDGDFYTLTPVASFSFTPDTYGRPIVGENVTFDARDSYDIDGTIVEYFWDFGDGTNKTLSAPNSTATHVYSEPSTPSTPYNVSLTVTDNDEKNNTISEEIHVKYHDIAILEVATPDEVVFHETGKIEVTVLNNGSHRDMFNVTAYYDSNLIGTETSPSVEPGNNETVSFDWYTYVNSSFVRSSNLTTGENWIYPSNVSASDNNYTYCNTNNTLQVYTGYTFNTDGWTGVSKVEVGIEVRTDTGGNDQISIAVNDGKSWGENHIFDIATTTDRFFWVDVTGNLSWSHGSRINETEVRIQYIESMDGIDATPIYVDWLRVRVSPRNPTDVPPGTYAIWANAYLVDDIEHEFRPGEEEDTADNTLYGNPIDVTLEAKHDLAVTSVEVSPTEIAVGRTSTVKVEIENKGNVEETFDVELYANSTEPIAKETEVRLLAGRTKTIRFSWYEASNTTVEGTYNITVYIPPVVDELLENQTNNVQSVNATMHLLPAPSFTFSPSQPLILEEVTFNGSESYAPGQPGGTIEQYMWDFGDGTTETYSGANLTAITTHIYNKPGTYSVKLTVVDNEDLNNTRTANLEVQKFGSNITISALPKIVPISLNTTISGSIKDAKNAVRANANVTIDYTLVEENTWLSLANLSTNDDGQYSFVWIPTEPGAYQIKASWQGDASTLPAESSVLNVTVIIQDTAIVDVVLSKIKVTSGESLTIDVTVANRGTATETFDVTVYYNDTLLETKAVTNLAADTNKAISFSWDTQGTNEGVYVIKAAAEPLPGEASMKDNSLTSGVFVTQVTPVSIYLYTTVGLAIAIAVMAAYLVKTLKSKPK